MDGLRGRGEKGRREESDTALSFGKWRGMAWKQESEREANADIHQTKSVETTVTAIQDDNDSSLPPLMNPSILEASDDLTNLSHLNEPAGMFEPGFYAKTCL